MTISGLSFAHAENHRRLLVVGHVFTVSIIRLLRELVGVFSLSLFPFGLFFPSPPIPFFVPAMQDNFPGFLTYIHTLLLPPQKGFSGTMIILHYL